MLLPLFASTGITEIEPEPSPLPDYHCVMRSQDRISEVGMSSHEHISKEQGTSHQLSHSALPPTCPPCPHLCCGNKPAHLGAHSNVELALVDELFSLATGNTSSALPTCPASIRNHSCTCEPVQKRPPNLIVFPNVRMKDELERARWDGAPRRSESP
jgi:hypothetical protein